MKAGAIKMIRFSKRCFKPTFVADDKICQVICMPAPLKLLSCCVIDVLCLGAECCNQSVKIVPRAIKMCHFYSDDNVTYEASTV